MRVTSRPYLANLILPPAITLIFATGALLLLDPETIHAQTAFHVSEDGPPAQIDIQVDRYDDLNAEDLDASRTWTASDKRWNWDGKTWGKFYFRRYCATCHGTDARGDGEMATLLRPRPANLTVLWKKYGSPLPSGILARFIDGRTLVAAHGNRQMPVWGEQFADDEDGSQGEDRVRRRIARLIDYLDTIQTDPDGLSAR